MAVDLGGAPSVYPEGSERLAGRRTAPRQACRALAQFLRRRAAATGVPFRWQSSAAGSVEPLQLEADPPWRFDLRVDSSPDAVVIEVRGDLDILSAPVLKECLAAAQSEGASPLILDLHALTFMDAIGLRVIANAHAHALAAGRALSLRHVPPQARRVLELTGVSETLRIESSG